MYFEWKDSLNTGIAEIDEQHRRIAHHINTLYEAQNTGDRGEVERVLEGLLEYTINHFTFEENLMEEAKYEFLRPHQHVHELFCKRIAEYRGRFANKEDITEELLKMLRKWLRDHIEKEDKAYLTSVRIVTNNESKKSWIKGLVTKVFG